MDAPEISVYGEAKGEYTRQLCIFLVPCLESYILELLEDAKKGAAPQKVLWEFQTLLQAIPDWNQDKVVRETERLQKDCRCDYLEELLTAVFIAHTKVLSAIRLTTKQKKLQITIPKLDHFLHRVLSESARSLWANAYLFAETNSIEKQKNFRQVAGLLHESVLQAIRGMLPVKSILREYLHDDEDDKDDTPAAVEVVESAAPLEAAEPVVPAAPLEAVEPVVPLEAVEPVVPAEPAVPAGPAEAAEAAVPSKELQAPVESTPLQAHIQSQEQPTIYIDTKPSVSFAQEHVLFDSNILEDNEIHDLPFAEAENREEEEEEVDTLNITDEFLPMEADEILG